MPGIGLRALLLSVIWLLSACEGSHSASSADSQPATKAPNGAGQLSPAQRPNFLIVASDDQSWAHTSFAGDGVVRTPAFDQIAREGVYFSHAYASAPSCTASRSALLSGMHFWQTGSGATLWGAYGAELPSLQGTLQQHGYHIGYTGKGWGPGVREEGAITTGAAYNQLKLVPPDGISNIDYSANFAAFLTDKPQGQPFSFLFTAFEPHRPYAKNLPADSHIAWQDIEVPAFLPDEPAIKQDIANYLYEIEWFDSHLSAMLSQLQQRGELGNTVVIVTSDNGMPFPRAKANNYAYGVRVPLAVLWQNRVTPGRQISDFINLADIAPTVLAAAGIAVPQAMTGNAFLQQLLLPQSGRTDATRSFTVTGSERHLWSSRPEGRNYPVRALHSDNYLYIHNLDPGVWPAGNPPAFSDIDNQSPSKSLLLAGESVEAAALKVLATAKRPAEELYFLPLDPAQLHNVAAEPDHQAALATLRDQLQSFLFKQHDMRVIGDGDEYDNLPYHGPIGNQ